MKNLLKISNLLYILAGTDGNFAQFCDRETRIKLLKIGACVLLSAIICSFGCGEIAFVVTDSIPIGIGIGLIMFTCVCFIDSIFNQRGGSITQLQISFSLTSCMIGMLGIALNFITPDVHVAMKNSSNNQELSIISEYNTAKALRYLHHFNQVEQNEAYYTTVVAPEGMSGFRGELYHQKKTVYDERREELNAQKAGLDTDEVAFIDMRNMALEQVRNKSNGGFFSKVSVIYNLLNTLMFFVFGLIFFLLLMLELIGISSRRLLNLDDFYKAVKARKEIEKS
jgi:hypothetical protein